MSLPPDPPLVPGTRPTAWRTLVGFHAGAGARAALRAGTIGVAALIFAFGSAPDPAYTLMTVVQSVVSREVGAGHAPSGGRVAYAVLAAALSALGAHRVTLGATGWMRSLPAPARTARRGAWAAAGIAAFPAAAFAAAALALTVFVYDARLDGAKVAGLPLLLAAAAAVTLRVEPRGVRALAATALLGAAWGTWPALVLSAGALGIWDRAAGGLAPPGPGRAAGHGGSPTRPAIGGPVPPGRRGAGRRAARLAGLVSAARWAWRAVGWRPWVEGIAAAAVPVAFAAFVRANNADLAASTCAWVARLGAGLGVAASVGVGAGALLARRPPWPWVRSLPWSAAERVAVDAVVLVAPAAGVGVIAAFVLEALAGTAGGPPGASARTAFAFGAAVASTGGAALGVAGVAALVAAAALRAGAGRQTGVAGELALVSVPAAVALAVRPALAVAVATLALAYGALAVRRERRAAGAVRWDELRHGAEGDVGWISRV